MQIEALTVAASMDLSNSSANVAATSKKNFKGGNQNTRAKL